MFNITRKHHITFIIFITGLVLGLLIITQPYQGFAQSNDSTWSDPVNISRAGGALEPHMVVDSQGQIHIYWLNEFDGLTYTYRDLTGSWSNPIPVQTPFEDSLTRLTLLSDPGGFVHGLWLDDDGNIFFSRASTLNESLMWEGSQVLASGAVQFHAVLDGDQNLHLAYILSEGLPSGIYYRIRGKNAVWSNPTLIYRSTYYRNLTPEDSHTWIDIGKDDQVYLGWDDKYTEQVFLVWSDNSGETWSEPILIDQRESGDRLDSVGPSNVMIQSSGDHTIVLWQAGHEGKTCAQYYVELTGEPSDFTNVGDDYQKINIKRQTIIEFTQECPGDLQVFEDHDGTIWLLSKSGSGLTLSTWSVSEWSPLQSQRELLEFIHPTTYRRLELDCFQYAIMDNQLIVIGCDTGETNDIWFTSRSLGEVDTWFPTPTPVPLWSTPVQVNSGDGIVSNPVLLTSPIGRMHAVWGADGGKIYYTYFDGNRWAQPVAVLTSPGERVGRLSACLDRNGMLFVTWDVPGSEAIYFSWVNEKSANLSQAWMAPQEVPIPDTVRSPQVAFNSEDILEIMYVVPLNERRGIYRIKSVEPIQMGQPLEWHPPELVVDAEAAGWAMVDDIRFYLGADETASVLWTNFNTPPDGGAVGLYYIRYKDGAWSEPKEIYQDSILWSQVLTPPDGAIHTAWQVKDNLGQVTLWHSYSTDHGEHWSNPIRILSFSSGEGSASLVLDEAGRLHLIQVSQSGFVSLEGRSSLILQNWVFNGTEWVIDERLTLDNLGNPGFLSTSIAIDGSLAAMLSADIVSDPADGEPTAGLFYSQRPVDYSEPLPTTLPTFTPNPTLDNRSPTLEPSPTPVLEFPTDRGTQMPSLFSSRVGGIIGGGIPATIIVGLVVLAIVRKVLKR